MAFSSKRAERLRERMLPRKKVPVMSEEVGHISSVAQLHQRMTDLQQALTSQGHLRQSMIMPARPLQWWEKEVVEYAFSHPHVRNRLERLMGSNVTRLTDRVYMQRLAERIQEEHVLEMQRRIRAREEAEVEREKKLILEGKIPVDQVPQELADHPVFKISRLTSEAIESRRSKVQHPTMRQSYIPAATLLALAKAMAPDVEDEEEEKDKDKPTAELDRPSSDKEGKTEEEEIAREKLDSQEKLIHYDMKDVLKDELEKVLDKSDLIHELRAEVIRQEERESDLKDTEKYLREKMEKKLEKLEEGEGESDEDVEDILGEVVEMALEEESEESVGSAEQVVKLDSLLGFPSPDGSFSYLDEDSKRKLVVRMSRRQKEFRRRQLKVKSTISTVAEDGRPLSADEIEREKATVQRTNMLTDVRNEWQLETEISETLARERDKNYMMHEDEMKRMRYEAPLVEELRKQETVADLYRLADEIVGSLWTVKLDNQKKKYEKD